MIIIKAGGSAITDKGRPYSIKEQALANMAGELANTKEEIIICHGGGSFGHPLALKYNIMGPIETNFQKSGVSKINIAMRKLSNIISESLEMEGCRPFALQSSAIMTADKGKILNFNSELVKNIVSSGYIPILYGDVVYDRSYSFSIISGDQIMRILAKSFPGSRIIFLTDVEGLYSADPKSNGKAKLLKNVKFEDIDNIEAGTTGDVTGGMKGKMEEILQFRGYVDEIIITTLNKKGALTEAIKGGNPGTRIFK